MGKRFRGLGATWLLPILLLGCSGDSLPPLTPVQGRVTLDGHPLPRGTVSLRAETSGTWDQPTGTIQDGAYAVFTNGRKGAPPGSYRVVIFATEAAGAVGAAHPGMPKSIVPGRYNDPQQTPLRLTVPGAAGTIPEATYNLELKSL